MVGKDLGLKEPLCVAPLFLRLQGYSFLLGRTIPCGLSGCVIPLGGQFGVYLCLLCVCSVLCVPVHECVYVRERERGRERWMAANPVFGSPGPRPP